MKKPQRKPPRIDPLVERIINSEAFRAINHLIDLKADEIETWMAVAADRIKDVNKQGRVRVRTSDEAGEKEKPLPYNAHVFEHIRDAADRVLVIEKEIGELQRFKLRLLNDYDFTHGDDSEQKAVFKDAPITP